MDQEQGISRASVNLGVERQGKGGRKTQVWISLGPRTPERERIPENESGVRWNPPTPRMLRQCASGWAHGLDRLIHVAVHIGQYLHQVLALLGSRDVDGKLQEHLPHSLRGTFSAP